MDDVNYLGLTLSGFQDDGFETLPIGRRHHADNDPGIPRETRTIADVARGQGWQSGIFHSGDGYMDVLIWRPIDAPHQVAQHMAELVAVPDCAEALVVLGISNDTFFVTRAPLDRGWSAKDMAGIHVAMDDDAFDRINEAWLRQQLFSTTPDMAALATDLADIARTVHAGDLEAQGADPAKSISDTMFEI